MALNKIIIYMKSSIILFIVVILVSCNNDNKINKPSDQKIYVLKTIKDKQIKKAINPTNENKEEEYNPVYFDYKNTQLEKDFNDTIYATFSNDTLKDCFTIEVPKGNINKTKTIIRIKNTKRTIIYEHIFLTSDLVNGYETDRIKSDSLMAKYVLTQASNIFKEGIINPKKKTRGLDLSDMKIDQFENYNVYLEVKKSKRNFFHYMLNEESHFYLGYSKKLKKVVEIWASVRIILIS